MRRAIAVVVALLAATSCGVCLAVVGRPSRPAASAEHVGLVFDAERALATAAGLTPVEEARVSDVEVSRDVPLAAGTCIAVVVGAEGVEWLDNAGLALDDGESVRLHPFGDSGSTVDRIAHLALCAREDTTAHIQLQRTEAYEDHPAPSFLRFAVLRGAVPSPRTYARLTVSDAARAELDAAAVREREARSVAGARIGDAVEVRPGIAILLPASRATFAGARALSGGVDLVPALDEPPAADPFRSPSDRSVPARAHTSTGLARLLAVVDAGALGAPCVAITVSRLDEPADWTPVRRIEIPSLEETTLTPTDPAIALDTICPARGLFLYVTDEARGGEYLLGAHAIAGAGEAQPSTFEPTALPMPEVIVAEAQCEAGDARGCVALGGLAAAGIAGAGAPRAALDRACTLGDGEGCDRLSALLARSTVARDRAEVDRVERQACAAAYAPACLRRAARFRDGARDLAAAYQTYRFACGFGAPEACTAVATMEEWQLATAAPAPTATALP